MTGAAFTPDPERDRRFMAAAIELGRRNNGRAWPNPSVGAIIVGTDSSVPAVFGRGTTAAGGRPHAETIALLAAGEPARGATAYVTLEPCSHHGRTPPCCEALVRAGVSRLVCAIEDPDPRVAGRGFAYLRDHGVSVTTGVLAREARQLHAGHLSRVQRGRPHVALKLAVSADGFIGKVGAGQLPISGPLSKAFALGLRVEHDAIMVGVGTVLADDPNLTCRLAGCEHRSPVRVILDSQARTPLTAAVVQSSDKVPTWIFVGPDAPAPAIRALGAAGVSVLVANRGANGQIDPADVLLQLGRAGITSVVSEGGSTVARALYDRDLIDEAYIVRSGYIVGTDGVDAISGLKLDDFTGNSRFITIDRRMLGPDRLTHYWRKEGA